MPTLLDQLASARWDVATRAYGSHHATLIGLLVQWWLDSDLAHWVVESGPSHTLGKGKKHGQCDAVFCSGEQAQGIVEIEGTRHVDTIQKMGVYFGSAEPDLHGLTFGVFLAYTTVPKGSGKSRGIPPLPLDDYVLQARQVTKNYPGRELAVLVTERLWEPQMQGLRARTEYFQSRLSAIRGVLVADGDIVTERTIYPAVT